MKIMQCKSPSHQVGLVQQAHNNTLLLDLGIARHARMMLVTRSAK